MSCISYRHQRKRRSDSLPFLANPALTGITELPFVFTPTFDEAVRKLEARLAAGGAHNPRLNLDPALASAIS